MQAAELGILGQREVEMYHRYHLHKELTAEALVDIRAATEAEAADHLDRMVVTDQTIQEPVEAAEHLLHFQDQAQRTRVADLVAVELTQEHTTQTHQMRQAAAEVDEIVHQVKAEPTD